LKNRADKSFRFRFYPLFLVAGYLCLLGIDVYLIDFFSKDQITNVLKKWLPLSLKINFLLLIIAVLICFKDLSHLFKKFSNRYGLFLIILFLFAIALVTFITPSTHRIYYDEDIYANVGQNMALSGETGFCNYGTFEYGEYFPHWISYNKEPSGWPFLISLGFKVFGTNEAYAFAINNLLLAFGVLVVFFITWNITGSYFRSYAAGLAFCLIPHNLIWSNTAAAEPSAAFFAGLAVLAVVLYLKHGESRHLFFLSLIIPFSCQMRPESSLIIPWAVLAVLCISPKTFLDRRLWSFGFIALIFLVPQLVHFYGVSGHSWGAQGSKFSLEFLENNLNTNGLYYLNNQFFPFLITAFAAIGLLFSRKFFRWRLLLLFWFLPFWGIFLFFYAGSYKYGADVRFALVSFMPIAILAGMGGGVLRDTIANLAARGTNQGQKRTAVTTLIILLMLFSFVDFLPLVRRIGQEAWGARKDHAYAKEFIQQIPDRSIVLTQNPTMFLLWGQNAIQTYAGVNNPDLIKDLMKRYQGHVYFHYNYWCNTMNKRNQNLCRSIRDRYNLEEIATAREQDYEYGLYRMTFKEK